MKDSFFLRTFLSKLGEMNKELKKKKIKKQNEGRNYPEVKRTNEGNASSSIFSTVNSHVFNTLTATTAKWIWTKTVPEPAFDSHFAKHNCPHKGLWHVRFSEEGRDRKSQSFSSKMSTSSFFFLKYHRNVLIWFWRMHIKFSLSADSCPGHEHQCCRRVQDYVVLACSLESQLTPPKFLPASIYSMQNIAETTEYWKCVLRIIYFGYLSFSFLHMLNFLVLPEAFL